MLLDKHEWWGSPDRALSRDAALDPPALGRSRAARAGARPPTQQRPTRRRPTRDGRRTARARRETADAHGHGTRQTRTRSNTLGRADRRFRNRTRYILVLYTLRRVDACLYWYCSEAAVRGGGQRAIGGRHRPLHVMARLTVVGRRRLRSIASKMARGGSQPRSAGAGDTRRADGQTAQRALRHLEVRLRPSP